MQSAKSVIAIAQMCSTNDKAHNLRQVAECVQRAASAKAVMLFLPECCDFVGSNSDETKQLSEPLQGETMHKYCELARQHNIWLSLGGLHETILHAHKIHNTHVLINNLGALVSVYRKLHLFDVDTSEFCFQESKVVAAGQQLTPPIKTPIGQMGLQICYDMRFVEPSLLLRKAGAEILTYPSAFSYVTGQAHWEILLRARAIETQCFVVAAAQVGWHNKKRRSWGHALAVDPWGQVLADCGGEEQLKVVTTSIDLERLQQTRNSMPCFEHRRNEIYSLTGYNLGSCEVLEDRLFAENLIDRRTIFLESAHSFAFTNLRCVVVGHVLVSTKRILPRLNGLSCAEMSDLFATVCRVQRMLEAYYNTTSATVTVQDGEHAGQTVPHVHFHVMPRRIGDFPENDEIYVHLDDIKNTRHPNRTMEERIEEAACYRKALQQHCDNPLLS